MRYQLAAHAFVCRVENQAVFLDLEHDRYFAIGAAQTHCLQDFVLGWSAERQSGVTAPSLAEPDARLLLHTLVRKGLLVADAAPGKPVTMPAISPVTVEPAGAFGHATRIEAHHVRRLVYAWAVAFTKLKLWPIRGVIKGAQDRKRRALGPKCARPKEAAGDGAGAADLVRIFYRLRPLFFTATQGCLFHSLVLIEFLARYRLYPDWVFGVKLQPFAAHCWVQDGSMILNGSAQHARKFIPIMVV